MSRPDRSGSQLAAIRVFQTLCGIFSVVQPRVLPAERNSSKISAMVAWESPTMSQQKRILLLSITIMTVVAMLVAGTSLVILYHADFEQQRQRLAVMAKSQACLLDDVVRFDATKSWDADGGGARDATLIRMVEAHLKNERFGKTGEFTLAMRDGDKIVFLPNHRPGGAATSHDVAWHSELAKPMRLALQGYSGTTLGLDYRGKTVLAAYEPVKELNLCIVAKIDRSEIRAPFVNAVLLTTCASIFVVGIGATCHWYIVNPLTKRLEENAIRFRCPVENAKDGVITINDQGLVEAFNHGAEQMFGYMAEEVIGRNVSILMPEPIASKHQASIRRCLESNEEHVIGESVTVPGRRKNGQTVPLTLTVTEFQFDGRRYFSSILRDDTERNRLEEQLRTNSQRLAVIAELSQTALKGCDLTDLCETAARFVSDELDVKYCDILEYRSDQHALFLLAGVGWPDGHVGRTVAPDGVDTRAGFTLRQRAVVVVKDSALETRFDPTCSLAELNAVSGMSVAIRGRDKPFGVLEVHCEEIREFADGDSQFLQMVANVLAEAIDRKEKEDKLERLNAAVCESDKRFDEVFSNSPDAILLIDGDMFVDCNEATVRMLGHTCRESVLMTHPSKLSPPLQPDGQTSREKANAMIKTALEQGTRRFEWIHCKANGEEFPVEVTLTAISYRGKRVLNCVWRDMTQTKRIQKRLKTLSVAVEQSPATIVITDTNGNIEYVNPRFCETTGYTAAEAIGKNPRILKSNEHGPEFYKGLWSTITSGNTWRGVFHNKRKDGESFWESASISPIVDSNGRILRFLAVKEELTDIKRTQIALKKSEERYRTLYESAHDAYVTVNEETEILGGNPAALKLFGCETNEDLIALNVADVSPGCQPDKTSSAVKAKEMIALAVEHGTHFFEWTFRRMDGTEFPATVLLASMEMDGKRVVQATIRDVSVKKSLERELAQAQKLESIGQLASGIAHEINTPTQYIGDNMRFLDDSIQDLISLVDTYAGMLSPNQKPLSWQERDAEIKKAIEDLDVDFLKEEIPNAIKQSLEGVDRVAKIVRSMKEFAHPGGDNMQLADLNHAIESTITVARNEWKYVAEMETDLASNLPLVPCLVSEFNQVILNMIINAAHAIGDAAGENTGKTGIISISTRLVDDWAEIRVRDTGSGIPEEVREKIFDPFFTTKEVGRGSGQGLAIARATIIKKHAGTIDVESEVGEGTVFIIRLPLERESAKPVGTEQLHRANTLS